MAETYVAEVRVFPFNFAPKSWAFCNGQILTIAQNQALFSLLGTYFGGNGTSSFGLPNMQGNVPIGQGNGAGLSQYVLGQSGGNASVALLVSHMASHNHNLMADRSAPDGNVPNNASLTESVANTKMYSNATGPLVQMNPNSIGPTGNNAPHNNLMPFLTLNFCISLTGLYPPRN